MTWASIETAPKDGNEILVRKVGDKFTFHYVAYWIEGDGWAIWSDDNDCKTCSPTHWMPIPAQWQDISTEPPERNER